jgi:hypothetical protein
MAHVRIGRNAEVWVPGFFARWYERRRVRRMLEHGKTIGVTVTVRDASTEELLELRYVVSASCSGETATAYISELVVAFDRMHRAIGGGGLQVVERESG